MNWWHNEVKTRKKTVNPLSLWLSLIGTKSQGLLKSQNYTLYPFLLKHILICTLFILLSETMWDNRPLSYTVCDLFWRTSFKKYTPFFRYPVFLFTTWYPFINVWFTITSPFLKKCGIPYPISRVSEMLPFSKLTSNVCMIQVTTFSLVFRYDWGRIFIHMHQKKNWVLGTVRVS